MTSSKIKNSFLRFVRIIMSFLLRYSISAGFSDFLLWPVSKRLFGNGYSEVVEIKKGVYMRVYGDMADMVNKTLLFMSCYVKLAWEPATVRLAESISPRYSSALVAGAHIGYYPIILSKANPKMLIYAFEPNPLNYERLLANLSLNEIDNVKTECAALGDVIAEKNMIFDSGQSTLVETSRKFDSQGMVSVLTADSFFRDKNNPPELMIFDAEGYEMNIFKGAISIIEKFHPDIIFEINPKSLKSSGSSQEILCDFLREKGYSIFMIEDNYSHKLNKAVDEKIKLRPYEDIFPDGLTFINAFATVSPELAKKYEYKR